MYWIGGATAVAQVWTASIDSVDATPSNNTFTVTSGGESISQAGDTDAGTTAAALVALLNASNHPYFAAITWSNPSGGDIVGTADEAEEPFVAALTKTGAGSGAVTDFAETTAAAGPHTWKTDANWDTGTAPVNSDDVVIDRAATILWTDGLTGITLGSLTILKRDITIGLPKHVFTTAADGSTSESDYVEYREDYLHIGFDEAHVGQNFGPGSPVGGPRIKLKNAKSGASTLVIHSSDRAPTESDLEPIRYVASHADADVIVRSAERGFGVAVEADETATIGDLSVTDRTGKSNVHTGPGVTMTKWEQEGGDNVLEAAATVATVEANGGTLKIEGEVLVTTLTNNGATIEANNVPSSGNAVTTANLNAGVTDAAAHGEARTWATVNLEKGAELVRTDALTVTTLNLPEERTRLVAS